MLTGAGTLWQSPARYELAGTLSSVQARRDTETTCDPPQRYQTTPAAVIQEPASRQSRFHDRCRQPLCHPSVLARIAPLARVGQKFAVELLAWNQQHQILSDVVIDVRATRLQRAIGEVSGATIYA
jgi:hypothetical protein